MVAIARSQCNGTGCRRAEGASGSADASIRRDCRSDVMSMKKRFEHTAADRRGAPVRGDFETACANPARVNNLFDIPVDFLELLDEIAIGVAVIGLDRRVVAMNQALKTITGFSREDLAGVDCRHVLRSNVCLQNCPSNPSRQESGPKCMEGNLINTDRQLIPIRITSAPLKNLDGRMVGFLETVEDISLLRKLDETASHTFEFNHIIGRSPEMEKIFQVLPSLAQTDSSVLITGETGTGKDLIAKAIHQSSGRAKGPFVKVNCGALPETLLESELFGHRKGAFTGAEKNKPGRFRLAHNGTLFLTEIGDLPLALQVKLLTFLDDKEVFPLGSVQPVSADVRIIAATNRNLEQRVKDQRFRKDLLFRLNVIRLHLPPLRDRQGDIPLLADHFLQILSRQVGKRKPTLSRKAARCLLGYGYPGNVRELRNIVEYAVNVCDDEIITSRHLPFYLLEDPPAGGTLVPSAGALHAGPETPEGNLLHRSSHRDWPEAEKQMILDALVKAGGRKNKAAAALGWARSTLWRKMKQYDIGG